MSLEVTTAQVEQYSSNVQMLSQQKVSRLRMAVDVESIRGKNAFFEQVGVTAARQRTTRHSDTPRMDTPHARRRVSLVDYDWADLIDDADKVRMLIDPTSPYAIAAAAAFGRTIDDVIIAAMLGTAYTGVTGSTSTTFDTTNNSIAHGSAGMTIAKILAAKEILDGHEVDESIPRYIALRSDQVTDLLNTTEIKSSDYNTVKALAQGQLNTFCGFEFIRTERLTSDGTSRECLAWAQDGLKLAIGQDVAARVSERADKNYSTQVFFSMCIGATRMEEKKIVEINCNE